MAMVVVVGFLGGVTVLFMTVAMAMAVSVVMAMFYSRVRNRDYLLSDRKHTMHHGYHQHVEGEANTPHDHDQARILDGFHLCQFPTESDVNAESSRLISMYLSMAWMTIPTPRANRKTPLKKAPSNWARCHPNENPCGELLLSEIFQE